MAWKTFSSWVLYANKCRMSGMNAWMIGVRYKKCHNSRSISGTLLGEEVSYVLERERFFYMKRVKWTTAMKIFQPKRRTIIINKSTDIIHDNWDFGAQRTTFEEARKSEVVLKSEVVRFERSEQVREKWKNQK